MATSSPKTSNARPPLGLRWRSSKTFIVATVGIGLIADLFLYALFVPILPFMVEDRLGLPPDQVQSRVSNLLAAYAGASVAASPFAGLIADQFSRRQTPFLLGLAFLCGATALLLVGQTMAVLLVARSLQGISAAFVWTVGLALCLETVGPADLGKALGTIFSFISVSNLMAPVLGGILYEKAGLAGVFGLAFALLGVDMAMRLMVIETKVAGRYQAANLSGTVHPGLPDSGLDPAATTTDSSVEQTPLLPAMDKEMERYKLPPDLPNIVRGFPILSCLTNTNLITALVIGFVQGTILGAIDATVPTVSKEWYNFSSLDAGMMFLPIGVANLLLGPVLGWCVDRFGTKKIAVLLYTYLVPVLLLFRFAQPGGKHEIIVYGILLALTGIGLAGAGVPSVVEAGTVVYKYHQANPDFYGVNGPYAQLYSLTNCCFSLGLAVGPELAGGLREAIGYGNMNAVLSVICGCTAVCSFMFLGNKPRPDVD